jgi:predicted nucleic acid-binding protein
MDQMVIIDSDFIVNLLVDTDGNHQKVQNYLYLHQNINFVCLNIVKFEVATVLSRKLSHQGAVEKFDEVGWDEFDYRILDEDLEARAVQIYKRQTHKNISLTDCAIVALSEEFNCKIASFDDFYQGRRIFD